MEDAKMFANVSTFQRRPERLDEAAEIFRDRVAPALKQQPGIKGAYVLVDRASGKSLSIALRESEGGGQGYYRGDAADRRPRLAGARRLRAPGQ
jgi:hypothetical protein